MIIKKLKDKSILVKRLKCITFNISEEECFQMMIIMLKKMVMRVGNRSWVEINWVSIWKWKILKWLYWMDVFYQDVEIFQDLTKMIYVNFGDLQ